MAASARRHISNPPKPQVFAQPPNLEVHMVHAEWVTISTVRITWSGNLYPPIDMDHRCGLIDIEGEFWEPQMITTINGLSGTTFEIDFPGGAQPGDHCMVVMLLPAESNLDQGRTIKSPDVIMIDGVCPPP